MIKPVRILGIAGSLRPASYNRAALRAATQLVPDGATLDVFELDGIPGFNQDEEQNPPAKVTELKRRVREADAILIVTPEIQLFYPGCVEERHRLGVQTLRRQRVEWETGGDHGRFDRNHRHGPGAIPPETDDGLPQYVSH